MKKISPYIFYLAFCFLIVLTSCHEKDSVRIHGVIKNIETTLSVSIYRQDFHETVLLNSKKVTPTKPSFKFTVPDILEPTFIHLYVEGKRKNVAVLLIEPDEHIDMEIDFTNFTGYNISGSEGSLKTKKLSLKLGQTVKTLDSLSALQKKAITEAEKTRLQHEYEEVIEEQREFSTNYIWENPRCRSSVMALYQKFNDEHYVFDKPEDIQLFKVVASSLIAMYPESNYADGMLRDIRNQEKVVSSLRMQELMESAESSLPEIALPNPKGDTIKLSSLRGKVILLDFWASHSQPSLLENRGLLEIYNQFNGKGFEIYQVSLDTEREPWLAAIESARLPWINVCELNERGSLTARTYNITRIPANFLIDRDFNIVGKDLYGNDLVSKLKETL